MTAWKKHIDQLPYIEEPGVFGMHENANIIFQQQETGRMMDTVICIQPRIVRSSGGKTNEQIVNEIAADILETMPDPLNKEEAGPNTFVVMENGLLHSLSTVLQHEMGKFNNLLHAMKKTLIDLQKALKGLVVLSAELDKMFYSLINNQVPVLWSNVAYPSLKPLASWVKDLHERVAFMRNWLRNGTPNCFWMSGFFFPQGFLTGVLQAYSRKYRIPIDTLSFKFDVLDRDETAVTEGPSDGVYIYGLFMDGARWDIGTQSLQDPMPGEMFASVPVIHFLPQKNYACPSNCYSCPLYKTSVRQGVLSSLGMSTNFVVAVDLPSKSHPSEYFVLKGVALVSMRND